VRPDGEVSLTRERRAGLGESTLGQRGGGSYRWRLKAANGQVVASSGEAFDSKANAQRAAENVKQNTRSVDIVDD